MFKNGKRIWSLLSSSWCHWSASSLNVLSPFVLCRVFQIVFDGCVFCRVIVVHRHSYVGDFDVMLYCSRHYVVYSNLKLNSACVFHEVLLFLTRYNSNLQIYSSILHFLIHHFYVKSPFHCFVLSEFFP